MAATTPITGTLQSVNVGVARPIASKGGTSGIDKRPVPGPVAVAVPADGRSGMAGDAICDTRHHGGAVQAVYAFDRDELDWWEGSLGRPLADGSFGENLTTTDIDTTGAVLGERWAVGDEVVLAVTGPRIPCATFATWMETRGFLKAFTRRARPGAYLRVVRPGQVRPGDPIVLSDRPRHGVTVAEVFRALTLEPSRLPSLLGAGDDLEPAVRDKAMARLRATPQ